MRTKKRYILASLFSLLSLTAYASGIAKFNGINEGQAYALSLEYIDRYTSRINIDSDNENDVRSYLLFRNRQGQIVTSFQGNILVMDLASMGQMAAGLGIMNVLGIDSETLLVNVISMEKTGKKEKVAGIDGDVYILNWSRNSVKQRDQLVLSPAQRAWEYTEAWLEAIETVGNSSTSINLQGDELLARLRKDRLGILRLGNRFKLLSAESKTVNPERFIAPDSSFEIPSIGGLLGNL